MSAAAPVGLRLSPSTTLTLDPPAAAELLRSLKEGGRMIRLAEGAFLALDDVRAAIAVGALAEQLDTAGVRP